MACGLRITGRGSRQGHGIHPMSAPGVTPAQAPEREPAAPCHTMQLQGFDGVFRAAGPVATAGRKDTAESALVALHHGRERPHERTPGFYRVESGQVLHRLWHDPDFQPLEG